MIDAHSAFGAVGTGPKRQADRVPFNRAVIEESAMLAVMGSAFTAFAIIAIALMALAFNHPRAPRWVQRELTAQLSAVLVTIILGVGLACLAMTAGHVLADGIALVELAALAGALALVVLVLRALKVGVRLQGYQVVTTPTLPPAI
jgi:multisubunit Na+/H+ antiporter MnhB subunit